MDVGVRVRKKSFCARQRPVTESDITDIENDITEPTDLNLLKEVSERLNLATRRPSTVQWKQVIEFRKSMGLYSSDVEPEFLDKIVEAKMKSDSKMSPSPKRNSPLVNGKVPHQTDPKKKTEVEDENNNNFKKKSPKLWRSKSSKKGVNGEKVNGLTIPAFTHKKEKKGTAKSSPKFIKKSEKSPKIPHEPHTGAESSGVSNAVVQPPVTSLGEAETNHCDVNISQADDGEVDENGVVCRFPLYDTDDENDDDTTGMSEMAIRYRNITRALGKIRRDLIIMRMEDNKLARKLLDARSEINLIRVRQSCDAHAEMLDDVTYELEEEDMLPGLIKACDLPSRPPGSLLSAFTSLRNIGVSRMNINRRRFSIR